MGWAGSSRLMGGIIEDIKRDVPDATTREIVYGILIKRFEEEDADTLMECIGEDDAFDVAMRDAHPSWFEDDGGRP